jgi:hypothetical protein
MTGVEFSADAKFFVLPPYLDLLWCPSKFLSSGWIVGHIFSGVQQSGHEADHLHMSNAEVKNVWSCTSTPLYFVMMWSLSAGMQLHGMKFV